MTNHTEEVNHMDLRPDIPTAPSKNPRRGYVNAKGQAISPKPLPKTCRCTTCTG